MSDYKSDLRADLADRNYAALYLSAALVDSPGAFLVALRDVAEAQQGVAKVAADAGVNRENLYRMLSANGNPRLETLKSVLAAMGLQMSVATTQGPTFHRRSRRGVARRKPPSRSAVPSRRVAR